MTYCRTENTTRPFKKFDWLSKILLISSFSFSIAVVLASKFFIGRLCLFIIKQLKGKNSWKKRRFFIFFPKSAFKEKNISEKPEGRKQKTAPFGEGAVWIAMRRLSGRTGFQYYIMDISTTYCTTANAIRPIKKLDWLSKIFLIFSFSFISSVAVDWKFFISRLVWFIIKQSNRKNSWEQMIFFDCSMSRRFSKYR